MRFLLNNYFLIEISAKILWRQNVKVDKYIENILNKLSNRSSNTGVIYLKETKLIDTQIKLLTDNIENALNRVIKLSERKK